MPSRELPARPNLDQLKKQAKTLLEAARQQEPEALARFAALPALKGSPRAIAADALALHDAQSVVAREHGFPSWNALREEVESRVLTFEAAVDDFVRCATGGATGRAARLLSLHPRLASTPHAALVLGDAAAVDAWLTSHPEWATQAGGPHGWEPLLYVCQTSMAKGEPARLDGLVAIARRLCALGANPNAEYHWNWHPELPRTALWGAACVVGHLPLAEVLLQAGANPTDGVTCHIATGHGDLDTLALLHRYGMAADGVVGGVPPLVYAMGWSDNPRGPMWLLDHGADANLAWGPDGEAPLHVAARRWDAAMIEQLLAHGAALSLRRADGATAHTLAELHGNPRNAAALLKAGAIDELSSLDRFVAACARGDRAAAEAMLATQPSLRTELRSEHHLLLQRHAESGDAAVLEAMLACGFDPRVADEQRVTPLHRAAMAGHVDAVRVLLAGGVDACALDGMFAATPLVWLVEGRSGAADRDGDYLEAARLLIDAGAPLDWTPPEGAPHTERTFEGLEEIRRALAPALSS